MSEQSEKVSGKEGETGLKPAGKFETNSDGLSDIILIVEDTKLYVHKTVLALNSPVFRQMFSTPNFKEGTASEIPLPDKKHQTFVNFLKQFYPETNRAPIEDDTLEDLLALADEYQVDFLVDKCREYLKQQLVSKGESLTVEQTLMYLYLCDKYSHHLSLWDGFLKVATSKNYLEVKGSKFFQQLPEARRLELTSLRCEQLESITLSQDITIRALEKHRESMASTISDILDERLNILHSSHHYRENVKAHCCSTDYRAIVATVCTMCNEQKQNYAKVLQSVVGDLLKSAKRDTSSIKEMYKYCI